MDEWVASRLLEFIEQTSDLVGVTDDAGNVVYLNEAARQRLGLGAGELTGLTTADLFAEEAFDRYFEEVRPEILRSGVWSGVIPTRTADGDSMDAWMTVVGGAQPGGDVGWLVTSGRDVSDWVRDRADLHWRATHDELTGVGRRVVLADRLQQALRRARRSGEWVGVLFVDVDRLKAVNDGWGHESGDRVLAEIARRIRSVTREVDSVIRVGGDEFVVILDGVTDPLDADVVTSRLQAVTDVMVPAAGTTISVSVSIGVALGDGNSDGDQLIRDADAAMYEAKRRRAADPVRGAAVRVGPARLTAHTVSIAVTQQLIRPHYQPVVDLRAGVTIGFQALARWGQVPAADFVCLVQDSGVGVALDLAILRRAAADARAAGALEPHRVYVHVSPRFLAEAGTQGHLSRLLERADVDAGVLALVVPEPLLADRDRSLLGTLRSMRALGVQLVLSHVERCDQGALDDLGGLFGQLRLARTLTAALDVDPSHRETAANAMSVARRLGMATIAVGVETVEQRRRLVDLGCELGIGNLLGLPRPALTADVSPP